MDDHELASLLEKGDGECEDQNNDFVDVGEIDLEQ